MDERMERIIALMKELDFSVDEEEYRAQVMKAVNDYADAKLRDQADEIMAAIPEGRIKMSCAFMRHEIKRIRGWV